MQFPKYSIKTIGVSEVLWHFSDALGYLTDVRIGDTGKRPELLKDLE